MKIRIQNTNSRRNKWTTFEREQSDARFCPPRCSHFVYFFLLFSKKLVFSSIFATLVRLGPSFFLLSDLKGFDLQKAWIFCCIAAVVAVVVLLGRVQELFCTSLLFRLTERERKCKKSQGETTRIGNKKQAAAAAALMMESRIFSRSS